VKIFQKFFFGGGYFFDSRGNLFVMCCCTCILIRARVYFVIAKSALSVTLYVCAYIKVSSNRTYVELPVYSKYLVIAAYIASYNPVKSDKRFFSKVITIPNTDV